MRIMMNGNEIGSIDWAPQTVYGRDPETGRTVPVGQHSTEGNWSAWFVGETYPLRTTDYQRALAFALGDLEINFREESAFGLGE